MEKKNETSDAPGDICPICRETMPPLDLDSQNRCQLSCCGQHICLICFSDINKHTRDAYEQSYGISSLFDGRSPEQRKRAFEDNPVCKCPLCRTPVPRSKEQSFQLALKNAESGLAWAQFEVGKIYGTGEGGVPLDEVEAVRWFKLAADQGHPVAMYRYAQRLHRGSGGLVVQNMPLAKEWYEKSAKAGVLEAQFDYGKLLAEGTGGVQVDLDEAMHYFRLAANQGEYRAQYALGWRYADGVGVDKDYDMALYWCTKGADQGDVLSMFKAGQVLLLAAQEKYGDTQLPGKSPIPRALNWYYKAAAKGYEPAKKKIAKLDDILSSSCAHCGQSESTDKELARCTKCKASYFCGRACQNRHWKAGHRIDCCDNSGYASQTQ